MRHLLHVIILVLSASMTHAADGKSVYTQYRQIIDNQTVDAMVRNRKSQEYLRSLNSGDFLAFVREVAQQPGYNDQNEGHLMAMTVFAKSYMAAPGRNEALRETLKQFMEPTLPPAWKIGLLDVLNLENRDNLTEEELSMAISVLSEMGQTKPASDVFRAVALQKLGSVLYTQRGLATLKTPDLKDALEKQDRSYLPKRDDATVRQAAKLIDAIRDYKVVLQKTADEVKDEQIKANLKKRLTKWDSVSVMPTK